MIEPIRILHVVGGMDRAGTETWLMHLLRNVDRRRFQMDFLVNADRKYAYREEIESLGSRVLICPSPSRPLLYARNFLRILQICGPYDVVHSHLHHFSGWALWLAKAAGVKTRIAHSHTNTTRVDTMSSRLRQLYLRTGRRTIRRNASLKVAVSEPAAECLFGPRWRLDSTIQVVPCGLDFTGFEAHVDRAVTRSGLGFGAHEFVIGHVGRFETQKNHTLLLLIFAELLKIRPEARLLLIGEGSLRDKVVAMAAGLGVLDCVQFTGARPDVARLMIGAMDVFVMPSLWEGLGLAAVEAQAAGLPTVLSDQIPADVDTQCGLTRFVSLEKPAAYWAAEILRHANRVHIPQPEALKRVSRSRFNIAQNVSALCQLYSSNLCSQAQ